MRSGAATAGGERTLWVWMLLTCVVLVCMVLVYCGYRCGVFRGRHLERAQVKRAEAEAEVDKKEEQKEDGQAAGQRLEATTAEVIWMALSHGERWHTHKDCDGLRGAKNRRKFTPCRLCAEDKAVAARGAASGSDEPCPSSRSSIARIGKLS